ncbi:MAG: dual specificity protein phosphatase [Candidatus Korobacteraceae bacterium]
MAREESAVSTSSQPAGSNHRMDMTWVTDRIAVGGGIWNDDKMIEVVRAGITHIIDMQREFDDTRLAAPYGVQVLWNPADDDFQPKPPALFRRGVDFALAALYDAESRVFIHCAAGVHRAPMMALALLRALGFGLADAMDIIQARRPVVDFADVYVDSVENFIRTYCAAEQPRR